MKIFHVLTLSILILLLSFGISTADTIPAKVAYIQGSHYVMSDGTDGVSDLALSGIVPYFNLAIGDTNQLVPIKNLSTIRMPVNAALLFSDNGSETVALVSISNLTFSDSPDTVVLQVKPLEFYEGTALERFKSRMSDEILKTGEKTGIIGLYLEIIDTAPENVLLPEPRPTRTDPPFVVS